MSSREREANEVVKRRRLTSELEPEEVLVPETLPYFPDTAAPEDPIPDTLEMDEQSQNLLELSEVDTDEEEVKHESDSDFESPNLLARKPRRGNKETLRREGSVKLREKEEEVKEGRPYAKDKEEDIESIENPNSSVEILETEKEKKIETFVSPMKKQKSVTKSTNRWGMEVNPITDSQKKRLRNQKQVREFYPKNAHFFTSPTSNFYHSKTVCPIYLEIYVLRVPNGVS